MEEKIRLAVFGQKRLSREGGIEIVVKELCTRIPDMILNSDFFAVRNSLLLIDNPVLYPAWFLHAKKGNKTIREIRNVAFACE